MACRKVERGGRGLRHDPPAHAAGCVVPVVSGIDTVRECETSMFKRSYEFDVRDGAMPWQANKSARQIGAAGETAFFNHGPHYDGRLGVVVGW